MDCERAQRAMSERLDGEHLSDRAARAVDTHLERCGACSAFLSRAGLVRASVRIRAADDVPDLVGPIMAAVAAEPRPAAPPRERRMDAPPARPRRHGPGRMRAMAPVAAALVTGMVVGSVLVGGPFHGARRGPAPASASIVPLVLARAPMLQSYQARYDLRERNVAYPELTERRFALFVRFHAPEQLSLRVEDRTRNYPNGWRPNDIRYVVNRSRSMLQTPTACPTGLASAACPEQRTIVSGHQSRAGRRTVITGRPPYSSASPLASDLVLPIDALTAGGPVYRRGTATIAGRDAIRIQDLSFERARTLFPFLSLGGRWRPFYPGDRVAIWLDAKQLFPVQVDVSASRDRARKAWESRFSLQREHAGRPLLSMRLTSFGTAPVPRRAFRVPRGRSTSSEGASRVSFGRAASQLTFPAPAALAGLAPYRAVDSSTGDGNQIVLAYASGLSWLKLSESRAWPGPAPFGVSEHAEEIRLPGGGVGYFEPAGAGALDDPSAVRFGRRLSIHTADGDLVLETNLTRERLLQVAARLPVRGQPIPASWSSRIDLGRALEELPFRATLPPLDALPSGYVVSSSDLTRDEGAPGITVYYAQQSSDLVGEPITVHLERSTDLAPPASNAERARIRSGLWGRFSPDGNRLEWIDSGVYRSVESGGLTLGQLVAIARSMGPE